MRCGGAAAGVRYGAPMAATLAVRTLAELTIDDEAPFLELPLYRELKSIVVTSGYRFRVLPRSATPRWDRALLLNLTFWGGEGGDVLPDAHIAADVVTHVAWHHLAARAFKNGGALSVDALFAGEAIASAFDVYLVGALLGRPTRRAVARSSFLDTQVPAMAESAAAAGLSARGFETLLAQTARDPHRAFEELRALLFDVTTGLFRCRDAAAGLAVLERHRAHRFAPLLHRFELSNWALWARAWAADRSAPDPRVRAFDRSLRASPDSIGTLVTRWVEPAGRVAVTAPRARRARQPVRPRS